MFVAWLNVVNVETKLSEFVILNLLWNCVYICGVNHAFFGKIDPIEFLLHLIH